MSNRDKLNDDFLMNHSVNTLNSMTKFCHGLNVEAGWWTDPLTGEDLHGKRNFGELIALCHSELSEALEGHRKNRMDDHLPTRKMVEVELADTIIRIFDLAGSMNMDLGGAFVEKLKYNATREDHKLENRLKEDGKKF